eukprot:5759645-Amphidinium_carterae.2
MREYDRSASTEQKYPQVVLPLLALKWRDKCRRMLSPSGSHHHSIVEGLIRSGSPPALSHHPHCQRTGS